AVGRRRRRFAERAGQLLPVVTHRIHDGQAVFLPVGVVATVAFDGVDAKSHFPDLDDVARLDGVSGGADAHAVEEGAVAAAQVADDPTLGGTGQFGVLAADRSLGQRDLAGREPAQAYQVC